MADLWMPGVQRADTGRRLTMRGNGPRLFTWHTFEAPYSYSPDLAAAVRYLAVQKSDPHFVFHPITGALVQMLPATTGGRTLRADGASTNTWGTVHMQVEVIGWAAKPWTQDLTPAGRETLARLLEFLRSWGIPDQWCHGIRPPRYPGPGVPKRQPTVSGHFHHAGWVVNNHGDPGQITNPWDEVATTPTPAPTPPPPAPTPGKPSWETPEHIAAVQGLLNAVTGAALVVDGIRGPATEAATLHYQTVYRDDLDTDGSPGPATRTALQEDQTMIEQLLQKVEALGTVDVQPGTADALATGQSGPRPLGWFLDLLARRAGRADQRAGLALVEVRAIRSVVDELAVRQGMTRDEVAAMLSQARLTVDVD